VDAQLGSVHFDILLNKADLRDQWSLNDELLAGLRSRGWSISPTSARTGDGVEQAFTHLGSRLVHET
jgi:hypothetical protein